MTHRGFLVLAIALTLPSICILIASFVPRTRRGFWITGLSFALIVFGAWAILPLTAIVTHRHLNIRGILMLLCNAYMVRMLFEYLRQKIREPKINRPPAEFAQHP